MLESHTFSSLLGFHLHLLALHGLFYLYKSQNQGLLVDMMSVFLACGLEGTIGWPFSLSLEGQFTL